MSINDLTARGANERLGFQVTKHIHFPIRFHLASLLGLVLLSVLQSPIAWAEPGGGGSGNVAPTITLTSPAAGASSTAPGSFTLSATASDSDGYVQYVQFYSNTVLVGAVSAPPYTITYSGLAAGSYSIVAKATDDLGKSKSTTAVSVTVNAAPNAPPSVSLTSPVNGSLVAPPGSFVLAASASDSDGTISSVQFRSGATVLFTDITAPYSYTWTGVAVGAYSITAVATDNSSGSTTSAPVTVTVSSAPQISVTRTYVYDEHMRLCKTINPESGATVVDYDAASNIAWMAEGISSPGSTCDRATVPESKKVYRNYDAMNRPIAVITPDGSADRVTTYAPDGMVSTLIASNPGANSVTTTYVYNKRRLLTREQLQVNSNLPWTFDYAYNSNGHLSSQTYPGALLVGYAPDALGRPTQAGSFASNVTYYPNGAISGFTYGNGIVHTMTQNARQLPARSIDAFSATKLLDDSYAYDANGNVLSLIDASSAATADNRTWGAIGGAPTLYDGVDRLLAVRSSNQWGSLTGNYNALYTYDAIDNLRTNRLGASLLTYGYDASNRLATLTYGTGAAQAVATDVAGNITGNAYRGQTYTFDLAHRMNAVVGLESYIYDGSGRRARTLSSTTGTIEYFGYGQDGRLLQDWSSRRNVRNGYVYLGNSLIATYGVTLSGQSQGAVNVQYKHTDALGSPVLTTDAAKAVLDRTIYTPYGAPTLPVDGTGYTGHFIDVTTGLTYMQQRYYDPQLGRFLSMDPAGAGFNQYTYANNNPYRFYDPDGRMAKSGDSSSNDTCKDSSDCSPPPDPMDDPDRPNGCGKVRVCVRDSDGVWHVMGDGSESTGTGGPGGAFVVDTIRVMKNGTTVTTFKPRPMTDGEARDILTMAQFPGASSMPMTQGGRDLATAMFWYLKSNSGAMKWMEALVTYASGGKGGRLAAKAHEVIKAVLDHGKEKLDGDKNYAELYAEFGAGLIFVNSSRFRSRFDDVQSGEDDP
jgi:RHS repeat-associated protein